VHPGAACPGAGADDFGQSRSSVVFRAVFFLPYILGEIVAGLIWRYMYDAITGGGRGYRCLARKLPRYWLAGLGHCGAVVWWFGSTRFHMALFVAGRQG